MIDVENLHLAIDGKEILSGVHLHLQPGGIYALLGPNGAGKSTTLSALLGLRAYASGRVVVLGGDPAQDALSIRRCVGVMPEKAGFYDWMNASAYLQWYGRLYGCFSSDRERWMLLDKVGLGAAAQRRCGDGAGSHRWRRGSRRRPPGGPPPAVPAALGLRMPHPKLLILDEPTNGLDPQGRRRIHDLLVEFAADGKTGVLLCTHLLDDVDRLCSRIGIISNGSTRFEGSLSGLLAVQGGCQRYRLRLETEPDTANLPAGVTALSYDGRWWRMQVQVNPSVGLSAIWGALWHRGWQILEIRSETSSLEEIYLRHTAPERIRSQEAAI